MKMNSLCQDFPIPQSDLIVDKILGDAATILKKKYKIRPAGMNVAMPSGIINLLGIHFQTSKALSKEEARKILVGSAQQLLGMINESQEIRPFLKVYPFTMENIDITLFINDSNGNEVEETGIGIASIKRGRVEYVTISTINDIPTYKNTDLESYEEALKILKNDEQ